MPLNPATTLMSPPKDALARLKEQKPTTLDAEKARLKKVTKEFEAFFMYYMLKTMRKTVPDNPLTKDVPFANSMGKGTFDQMLDMEVSREMAQGERKSMGDMLYDSFEKIIEAKYNGKNETTEIKPLHPEVKKAAPIDLKPKQREIKVDDLNELKSEKREEFVPVSPGRAALNRDHVKAKWGALIDAASRATKLDSTLIASVIRAESDGNSKAVSPAGAKGLMQLADSTASDYGVSDPFDPKENIMAGSKYLKNLLDRFGDIKLALAAYNAGPGNVNKYGGIPPFRETQDYVTRVTGHLEKAGVKIAVGPSKV